MPRLARSDPAALVLSRGPSSFGEAVGAVAIVLADGALNNLADAPAAAWSPWLGGAVAVIGVHAVWEIARTRRIVAGPAGLHWTGGLSPSAGSAGWDAVCRIDALQHRGRTHWRIEVLEGHQQARLLTLRGPGRWADVAARSPERLAALWGAAGGAVRARAYPWGWRLEAE